MSALCQQRKSRTSFNYLGRKSEEGGWHGEAEFLGGLQIDDQEELGGLIERNVARFGAYN